MARHDIGALDDFPQGRPAKVEAGETPLLIVRRGDDVNALSHACPHYGLPLSKGHLDGDRLICAFHHACFDVSTGRQTEPPGHGNLRRYDVAIEDGRVIVDVPPAAEPHPAPPHARRGGDVRRVVIVGAGAAGDAAAHELRDGGFCGAIEMVSPEAAPPYDRTLLSKAVLAGSDPPREVTITDRAALAARDVHLVQDRAEAVDPAARQVRLRHGGPRSFDACLVAPGGVPRRLGLPGEDLPGVHLLRSRLQAEELARAAAAASRAVLVGSGFIGLEAALGLARRGIEVTVVTRHPAPLAQIVGERAGRAIRREHEEAGVRFVEGEAAAFEGAGGRLGSVRLADGSRLRADIAVVAVGIRPATGAIGGLDTAGDGGVRVGADLSVPGGSGRLFVGGDCAIVPTAWGQVRIEHWRVARQHGVRAARAILGQQAGPPGVPFFWTALGRQYRYVGHAGSWDEIVFDGAPEEGPFVASYLRDGRVAARFGAGRDGEIAATHAAMLREGGPLRAPP